MTIQTQFEAIIEEQILSNIIQHLLLHEGPSLYVNPQVDLGSGSKYIIFFF